MLFLRGRLGVDLKVLREEMLERSRPLKGAIFMAGDFKNRSFVQPPRE